MDLAYNGTENQERLIVGLTILFPSLIIQLESSSRFFKGHLNLLPLNEPEEAAMLSAVKASEDPTSSRMPDAGQTGSRPSGPGTILNCTLWIAGHLKFLNCHP